MEYSGVSRLGKRVWEAEGRGTNRKGLRTAARSLESSFLGRVGVGGGEGSLFLRQAEIPRSDIESTSQQQQTTLNSPPDRPPGNFPDSSVNSTWEALEGWPGSHVL